MGRRSESLRHPEIGQVAAPEAAGPVPGSRIQGPGANPRARVGADARIGAGAGVEWRIDNAPIAYSAAVRLMENRVARIRAGEAPELVWLLEHPPLYTAGTSTTTEAVPSGDGLPVHRTGRGGQVTYHGPGQRIAYVMLDLERRGRDVRAFVHGLEEWIIRALAGFDVTGLRREGRVGIWVDRTRGREDKIAAIGVRIRRWVTYHGIAVNIDPDLSRFDSIEPCGINAPELGVTSLADLGLPVAPEDFDAALRTAFEDVFGK